MNDVNFIVDSFSFLHESIPSKVEVGLSLLSSKVTLTCFDVNERLLVFGSDCGVVYGFRRGEKATKKAHFRMAAVTTSITNVRLIECDLLAFSTGNQLVVYTLNNLQILYLWKNERNGHFVNITTFSAFMNPDLSLTLISGDKLGCVHKHQVSQSKAELLFEENESANVKHSHEVTQIEAADSETILVSTCSRSVIIKLESDKVCVTQIGKNARKVCGNYGAVFCGENLYAARPSLHLIKANKTDGNVVETFILKKAKDPPSFRYFCDVRCVNQAKPSSPQLGSLIVSPVFDCLISWNSRSFLVVDSDGRLLVKENNLMDLIDVKTSSTIGYEDIFLLFKNRSFLRLRRVVQNYCDSATRTPLDCVNRDLLQPNEAEYVSDDKSDISEQKTAPSFNISPFGQMGELKRIFNKLQNKLTGEVYTDKTFDVSSTETTSNSDVSECESRTSAVTDECSNDVLNEPLVVHKKYRRIKHKTERNKNAIDSQHILNVNEELMRTSEAVVEDSSSSASNHSTTDEEKVNFTSMQEGQSLVEDIDDVETRLSNILKAFRLGETCEDSESSVIAEDISPAEEILTISVNEQNRIKQEIYIAEDRTEVTETVDIYWNLVLEGSRNVNKMNILSLCASSYDDQIGVGYVWLSCLINKQVELYYLPSFKSIKSPASKSKIISIGVNTKQILVLFDDGNLYCRWGDSTKPLSNKWIPINVNRPQCKLCTISANNSNSVVWCCDYEGNSWLLKSTTSKTQLIPIRDDNEITIYFKAVVVAPQDSSLVWAISTDNYVYMRNGIFNENGIDDELIAGISWLKVEAPVVPKCIAVTAHSVWLLNDEGNRIFRRIGIEPPFDLLGNSWQEVRCPTLVNDCVKLISASLNDDIWLLTSCGSVWQHCQHPLTSLQEIESDWILVK
ncbi:tectonin beta-propeller repeat-containing protein 2-like protein [Leptotrombidium deliense]|uniref:Tectonin beta-propeller repeat-containing protein 2-like protein n=1 Tax=Leptotrombidium deliense TaxID=299467 RepID=A0A443SQU2_9ACAR|nr:tectonin beta-propeller repeat-containing protein 2-like protein [Leptotrombidium deliense]